MPDDNILSFRELTSPRLKLRKLILADSDVIFHLRTHPEVIQFVERKLFVKKIEAEEFITSRNEGIQEGKWLFWGIEEGASGRLIGTICLWNFDHEKNEAEVGYELHPTSQGKGFMSEALKVVLDFGFGKIKLNAILAFTHFANLKSIRLLQKFGFEAVPEIKDEDYPENVVFKKKNPLHNT